MTITKVLGSAVAALVLSAGVSMAENTAPVAPAKPAVTAAQQAVAKPAKMAKMHNTNSKVAVRSEASKACSAQADAKSLHGQPRREFRKSCMKTAAAAKSPVAKAQAVANVKPAAGAAPQAH